MRKPLKANVFINQKLNNELDEKGIAHFKLKDLATVDRCQSLIEKYAPPVPESFRSGFYAGVMDNDVPNKKRISEGIIDILKPELANWIHDYKPLSFTYLVKGVNQKSMLDVHQDWSMVDETKYQGYNLWMPLSDSNLENGTLFVLEGSHRFPLNRRGGGIVSKYIKNRDLVIEAMTPFNVKRGEAVLFDNRLIHYSPANKTPIPRFAIVGNVVPNDAPVTIYTGSKKGDKLEVKSYSVPDDFYFRYSDFHNQKDLVHELAVYIEDIPDHNSDQISDEEFTMMLSDLKRSKKGFIRRILGI